MKIIVNDRRTVHLAMKPGVDHEGGKRTPPVRKAFGPGNLIEVPDEEARFLMTRGFASKYEERKAVVENAEKPSAEKTEPPKSK